MIDDEDSIVQIRAGEWSKIIKESHMDNPQKIHKKSHIIQINNLQEKPKNLQIISKYSANDHQLSQIILK